jgi:hypothetical protein
MSIHTQLCTYKTADKERLHGLFFTPSGEHSDLPLVFVHGVAMNFYLQPLAIFGQALAERRYHCFVTMRKLDETGLSIECMPLTGEL